MLGLAVSVQVAIRGQQGEAAAPWSSLIACRQLHREYPSLAPPLALTSHVARALHRSNSVFTRLAQLERSLQRYLRCYNRDRIHRGYRLNGKTLRSVFHA
jgi:hypothetical protein